MSDVQLLNRMEKVTNEVADEMLKKDPAFCRCSRCHLDVVALALNTLPPRYVVTEIGEVFTNVNLASAQWRADVMTAVLHAMEIVRKKPRHNPKNGGTK